MLGLENRSEDQPILRVVDIQKSFGALNVLQGVSFELRKLVANFSAILRCQFYPFIFAE